MQHSQGTHNKLYCSVCDIFLGSKAKYAFHVLTMEHCENFKKFGKYKPKSTKNDGTSSDMGKSKATPATVKQTNPTSIPPYAYFVTHKSYSPNEQPEEMDKVKNGPLRCNFTKTFKEQDISMSEFIYKNSTTRPSCKSITKGLISCEVCSAVLTEIPDYKSHVKSPGHILNMKWRGMCASGHVAKANSNSCKTYGVELSTNCHLVKQNDSVEFIPPAEDLALMPFPLLYCSACELLLNSPQQFSTHVNGESHKLHIQKKGKVKGKKEIHSKFNKYHCYSCKLELNGSSQLKEHRSGKKHKIRCRQLMNQGIVIPFEEQLPDGNLHLPMVNPEKPERYPDFNEEFVLVKQKERVKKSSELRELLMFENNCDSDKCKKILDTTTPTNISGVQDLNTSKDKTILHHIYRVEDKCLNTVFQLPFTIVGNDFYFRNF